MRYRITVIDGDSCVEGYLDLYTDRFEGLDLVEIISDALGEQDICQCDDCGIAFDGEVMKEDNIDLLCSTCYEKRKAKQ